MKILIRTLLITAFCLTLMLVYVSTTERGLKQLWVALEPMLPAGLSIENLEGRLIGPLTVTGLKVRRESFNLDLDRAELDWTPSRLLSGVLKVDRLALPRPDVTDLGPQKSRVAPRDNLELQLVDIWQNVLGVRPVESRIIFLKSADTHFWPCIYSPGLKNY